MKKIFYVLIAVVFVFSCVGCMSVNSNGQSVQRINPNKQTDLSGYWNDTDVRIIAETLVEECVNAPAIIRYIKENQREPVVQLGSFKNRSDEHLDTAILATKFKVALINSGKVKFSAEKEIKEELREEILAQQDWASEETAKKVRKLLRSNVENYYGDNKFPGLKMCGKTGSAEVSNGKSHAWFVGFSVKYGFPYAVVVCLENGGIGYEITCSVSAFSKMMQDREGALYTYLQVRDDGISLRPSLRGPASSRQAD